MEGFLRDERMKVWIENAIGVGMFFLMMAILSTSFLLASFASSPDYVDSSPFFEITRQVEH